RRHRARIALLAAREERRHRHARRRGQERDRPNAGVEGEGHAVRDRMRIVDGDRDRFEVGGVVIQRVDHDLLLEAHAEAGEKPGPSRARRMRPTPCPGIWVTAELLSPWVWACRVSTWVWNSKLSNGYSPCPSRKQTVVVRWRRSRRMPSAMSFSSVPITWTRR